MRPCKFEGANVMYGANQPEYVQLPAEYLGGQHGQINTCWELSGEEVERIRLTGQIWLSVLTFGQPLQPVLLSVERPKAYDG